VWRLFAWEATVQALTRREQPPAVRFHPQGLAEEKGHGRLAAVARMEESGSGSCRGRFTSSGGRVA